ncbi:hypothetical protein SteCoe_6143 [Stentor coeruleus]|uniref:Uncharacterized protein n=1 Tax=Stentor coeruleus TaxID=5963 RepID=A0A1R2CQR6_9CILI|nr:hypothetical protein SteCoe_6143 [Stentor coeruleus]
MESERDNKIERAVYSQKSGILIDSFLCKVEPELNFRCYELRSLFYQTIAELSLSEIEIIAWLFYIEKIGMNVNSCNAKEFLIFVGLHSKICLGNDIKLFLEKFKAKNPRTYEKFKVWSNSNEQKPNISTIELGKKYRELSQYRGANEINYNFYLNDILRSCTVYQKQNIGNAFDLSLKVEKINSRENIFQIKKKVKIFEVQEYDLKEFDRIDA